jgi:hypothetical protein
MLFDNIWLWNRQQLRQCAALCSSAVVYVWQCGRGAVCGNAHTAVCGCVWQCVAVCGSARGCVQQCVRPCAAVCGSVTVCGSARGCVQQCVWPRAAVCGSVWQAVRTAVRFTYKHTKSLTKDILVCPYRGSGNEWAQHSSHIHTN